MTIQRLILPGAPDPEKATLRDVCIWIRSAKRLLEDYSRVQSAPAGQQLLASNFTTNTVITGTSTLADVANYVATFVTALTNKGIVSPTVTRQSNE